MHLSVISRILGVLLMLFSITQVPPIMVSLFYNDGAWHSFGTAMLLTLGAGALIWLPVRNNRRELRTRDCFLVVTLFWTVLGTFGCLPFLLSPSLNLSVTDAVFESI